MTALILLAVLGGEPAKEAPRRYVVSTAEAPAFRIADGKGTATLFHNASTGSPEVALSRLRLEPGAAVPEHSHETGEWLMVVSGQAELTIDGQALTVKAGDAVFIPRGSKHTAKVAVAKAGGADAFDAVQVYSPAGAEQRYAKGQKVK